MNFEIFMSKIKYSKNLHILFHKKIVILIFEIFKKNL
jgi:hypothetical protein